MGGQRKSIFIASLPHPDKTIVKIWRIRVKVICSAEINKENEFNTKKLEQKYFMGVKMVSSQMV